MNQEQKQNLLTIIQKIVNHNINLIIVGRAGSGKVYQVQKAIINIPTHDIINNGIDSSYLDNFLSKNKTRPILIDICTKEFLSPAIQCILKKALDAKIPNNSMIITTRVLSVFEPSIIARCMILDMEKV